MGAENGRKPSARYTKPSLVFCSRAARVKTYTKEGPVYSTDKEIEDLLSKSANAEEFKSSLASQMEPDVESDLASLLTYPSVTLATLSATPIPSPIPQGLIIARTRNVSLFETSTDHPLGETILAKPHSDPHFDNQTGRFWYLWSASLDPKWTSVPALNFHHGVDAAGQPATIPYPASVRILSARSRMASRING
jgi:hypothetical protein